MSRCFSGLQILLGWDCSQAPVLSPFAQKYGVKTNFGLIVGEDACLRIAALGYRILSGAVDETRTRDRRFRKPLLYPAELPPLM